jgi:hypothetical protein
MKNKIYQIQERFKRLAKLATEFSEEMAGLRADLATEGLAPILTPEDLPYQPWFTIGQAVNCLGVSQRTVWRPRAVGIARSELVKLCSKLPGFRLAKAE